MSMPPKTFVLHSAAQWNLLSAFVKANAAAMAEQGTPLAVRVYEYAAKASDEQRALIWIVMGQIADQAWVKGRQFDAETWHEHAKRLLLPEETAKGKKKWRVLPDGTRALAMGTEDLSRKEKTVYIDSLLAWAAAELGIDIHIKEAETA